MYSNKPKGKEKLNSISDCLNGLMDNLQKKKNHQDRNFKVNISLNSINLKNKTSNKYEKSKSKSKEKSIEKGIKAIKGLSLEKIHNTLNLNFDKKYIQIMTGVSPKANESSSNKIKNANLWDLKLKNNSIKEKDGSSKAFRDFKMRLVYNQDQENYDEQMLFMKNIKRSNSSDFFKTTSNSENKTFSSSRNSFNPMPYYSNSNFNNFKDNTEREREREKERNENISFYSFKSISSSNHNNIKKNSDSEYNISPKSSFINGNLHGNGFGLGNGIGDLDKKTKRVNFDYFNSIGENPYKINIYDKNSSLYSSVKKYSKYGNMKEGYNLSPKNIYSPWKYSNNNKGDRYLTENKIFSKDKDSDKGKNNFLRSSYSKVDKSGISNQYTNSKQYTMKKIDNMLKNFNEINSNYQTQSHSQFPQKKIISLNSPKSKNINNNNNNYQGSFLNKNDRTKRLYSFINK